MKKIVLILMSCGFFLLCVSGVQATSLTIEDEVRFTEHGISSVGNIGTAGEFKWESNKGYQWSSFCVELGEHVSKNVWYDVHALADVTTTGSVLKEETAWLFWKFANNELADYDTTIAKAQTDLQALIWLFQGEIDSLDGYDKGIYFDNWESQASAAVATWSNGGRVKVVQLLTSTGGAAQDQLVLAPVPEPATMVLFGIGLLGLASIGRKRTKK